MFGRITFIVAVVLVLCLMPLLGGCGVHGFEVTLLNLKTERIGPEGMDAELTGKDGATIVTKPRNADQYPVSSHKTVSESSMGRPARD